jgi:hypothetical protein
VIGLRHLPLLAFDSRQIPGNQSRNQMRNLLFVPHAPVGFVNDVETMSEIQFWIFFNGELNFVF